MADYQYDGQARSQYVAKAEQWTERQAARLGYTPDEILAAVRKGWTPDRVEALPVAEAHRLEGRPGLAPEIQAKLKAAPVLPVRNRGTDPHHFKRRRDRHIAGPNPYAVAAE